MCARETYSYRILPGARYMLYIHLIRMSVDVSTLQIRSYYVVRRQVQINQESIYHEVYVILSVCVYTTSSCTYCCYFIYLSFEFLFFTFLFSSFHYEYKMLFFCTFRDLL